MTRVHPLTRVFVYGLLLAVVLPPYTQTEHWPFTSLKLFSVVRGPVQTRWEAVTVDADGHEYPVPWDRLPRTFTFHNHVLRRFPAMTPTQRESACQAWGAAALDAGVHLERLRIYRVQRRTRTDGRAPGDVVRRDLRYQCEAGR